MPIISRVGNRSWGVRALYGTIFIILGIGAITMIYPLMLMVSGSVKSETDFLWITPFPEYITNDDILWMKYVESKHTLIPTAEATYQRPIGIWRSTKPPKVDQALADAFRKFRDTTEWPDQWYMLGHNEFEITYAKNARVFRAEAQKKFNGNLEDLSRAFGVRYATWSQVGPANLNVVERRFTFPDTPDFDLYKQVKRDVPSRDRIVANVDGDFWLKNLRTAWSNVQFYNAAHGTGHQDYGNVVLSTKSPPKRFPDLLNGFIPSFITQERTDWELYVREMLNTAYIRIDPSAQTNWQNFLKSRYNGDIHNLNVGWGEDVKYAGFSDIPLPDPIPPYPRQKSDLSAFLKDRNACPLEALSINGPRQAFMKYLADAGHVVKDDVILPLEQADYLDFKENTRELRWEFLKRNYIAVLDYLVMHGNGIRNTVIYCTLMIAATLLVNPLAAYALSRYRPPSTYTILLFCMCTMAFPAEVTMIPSFLLLKQFPLLSLVIGAAAGLAAGILIYRLRSSLPQWFIGVLGGAIGILAGWWLFPMVTDAIFGKADTTVSLLNTFWALVLPAMANGFSIFLLKGFFDSLPKELYEAADIDGASEWHKFWIITMSLSKPILAVLALGAFTAAYSEFMMALVIIPDQDMWTIMVWLFQLQQRVHPSVVYASLRLLSESDHARDRGTGREIIEPGSGSV
jgi:multiple sugar transport system permease protein